MFESVNTNLNYTFTQSENSNTLFSYKTKKSSASGEDVVVSKNNKAPATTYNNVKTIESGNIDTSKNADTSEPQVITLGQSNDEDDGSEYLYSSENNSTNITNSFDALSAAVGGINGKVTKEELETYLQSLKSNASSSAENAQTIAFLKGLIAQFDVLSGGAGYITSLTGANDAQDYETVTSDQVTPPISLNI